MCAIFPTPTPAALWREDIVQGKLVVAIRETEEGSMMRQEYGRYYVLLLDYRKPGRVSFTRAGAGTVLLAKLEARRLLREAELGEKKGG